MEQRGCYPPSRSTRAASDNRGGKTINALERGCSGAGWVVRVFIFDCSH